MPEEILDQIESQNQVEDVDAISIIQDLKANTVPKDKYQKVVDDNARLMKALANGETVQVEAPKTPSIEELRSDYLDHENKSDLQRAKETLALRDALIEAGKADPFLPNGDVELTEQDYKDAQDVADLLRYAIDNSGDDNAVFLAQFSSKIIDAPIPKRTPKR